MSNQRWQNHSGTPPKDKSGKRHDSVNPIKTANWPGLPGKTQSKDRSAGVKKIPQGAKQEGI